MRRSTPETAAALVAGGARTVLACRDRSRAEAAAAQLRARHTGADVEILEVDLGDLDSVRRAASEAHDRFECIDALINSVDPPFRGPDTRIDDRRAG